MTALRKLEERQFVTSQGIERERGVPRKYYRLTEKGFAKFIVLHPMTPERQSTARIV